MIRQRVLDLALGHEDLNDHDQLRTDPLLATCGNPDLLGEDRHHEQDQGKALAGKSTLNRFELGVTRGDMKNRIKEQQLDLFADRSSTAPFASNQLRLWFSTFAYLLICYSHGCAPQPCCEGNPRPRNGKHSLLDRLDSEGASILEKSPRRPGPATHSERKRKHFHLLQIAA